MKTNAAAPVMEARLYKRAVRVLAAENCRRPVVKRVLGNPGETGTFQGRPAPSGSTAAGGSAS